MHGYNPRQGKCTVSGWGATDSSGSIYPDDLRFGDITGLSDDDCQTLMDNLEDPPFGVSFVPSANFCAFTPEGGLNACFVSLSYALDSGIIFKTFIIHE